MRVPDGPVGGRGGALGWAFSPGRKHGRISDGRLLAGGCVHDPRSERPRGGRLSRLPPAFGRRMVGASDRRGSGTGIRADLVASGNHAIEQLTELPLMSDPGSLATLGVVTKVLPTIRHTDANLLSLAICKAVNLSLDVGNADSSCVAYVWLGVVAGARFGNYKAGFRFGQLGYELVERRGLRPFQVRTYLIFG